MGVKGEEVKMSMMGDLKIILFIMSAVIGSMTAIIFTILMISIHIFNPWVCERNGRNFNIETKYNFPSGCLFKYNDTWLPLENRVLIFKDQ